MTWIVYILECSDHSLYTGITTDMARRMQQHTSGIGAKYTKRRGPFVVRYAERQRTRSAALKREAAIKSLDRSGKLALITAWWGATAFSTLTLPAEPSQRRGRPTPRSSKFS